MASISLLTKPTRSLVVHLTVVQKDGLYYISSQEDFYHPEVSYLAHLRPERLLNQKSGSGVTRAPTSDPTLAPRFTRRINREQCPSKCFPACFWHVEA